MKLKILLWSVISVLVLGAAAGAYWWMTRPQVIVLDDGSELTLLAVTYGKHHVLPKAKTGGRKLQNSTLNTGNDAICVWIEQKHEQNYWPNYQLMAYDPAGTGCAVESTRTYAYFNGNRQGDEVMGFAFESFPRRGSKVYFRIKAWNNQNGQQDDVKDYFVAHTPSAHTAFGTWSPEKLPITQADGDLQVTLSRVEVDANGPNQFAGSTDANDPASKGVLTAFHIEQSGILVTNWQPVEIETSDGSGNHSRSRSHNNRVENDEQVMTYQYGLWPNEPAWKLRVEMSRLSGFHDDEIFTATNVPVNPGDMNAFFQNRKSKPAAETTLGETKVQVFPAIKLSEDQMRNYGNQMEGIFRIRTNPSLKGSRMTIVKITDEKDHPVSFGRWGDGFSLQDLGDAKSLNVTVAVHRSRFFEFTVAPPKK